jgi:hypothetical protein
VQVDREKLLQVTGVASREFNSVVASMADLIFDVIGTAKRKRKAAEVVGNRDLLDLHPACVLWPFCFCSLDCARLVELGDARLDIPCRASEDFVEPAPATRRIII